MPISIAHLGPSGTYTELAALVCANLLNADLPNPEGPPQLCPYPSIVQALYAVSEQKTQLAVVPVENSIEGGVGVTLDTVWQLDALQIQQALVLPISHALLSCAAGLAQIQTVYSHPQALAQCQGWLTQHLPWVELIPTNSTTESLQYLKQSVAAAAIASRRAAKVYSLPILAYPVNDHPDNCTRFWVLGLQASSSGSHTSLAFSLPTNVPGGLMSALQVFARRDLNLSRIESRPTKRSLGDYLFFIDIESSLESAIVQAAIEELRQHSETLKLFGSYSIAVVPA